MEWLLRSVVVDMCEGGVGALATHSPHPPPHHNAHPAPHIHSSLVASLALSLVALSPQQGCHRALSWTRQIWQGARSSRSLGLRACDASSSSGCLFRVAKTVAPAPRSSGSAVSHLGVSTPRFVLLPSIQRLSVEPTTQQLTERTSAPTRGHGKGEEAKGGVWDCNPGSPLLPLLSLECQPVPVGG